MCELCKRLGVGGKLHCIQAEPASNKQAEGNQMKDREP